MKREKNIQKLIIITAFVFFAVFPLSGCHTAKNETDTKELQEDFSAPESDLIVVGFSQLGSESDWRVANTKSFYEAFTEENGYLFLYEDGAQKQENQVKALRNFILQEVDYIVLDPIVETGWDAVLKEARDANIPVILADRSVSVSDENLYTCWVGSDFTKEGRDAGEWLAGYLNKLGRDEETITIVTLMGTPNSSAQIGRSEGFKQVLMNHKNWIMLERESGEYTQAKGEEVMNSFLNKYSDIDVIICENDNMAFGAINALKAKGKKFGSGGGTILISFDAVNASFDAMINGEINADFECNPLLGPKVAEIIQKLEKGETVEKIQYVDETYFDTSMDLYKLREDRKY